MRASDSPLFWRLNVFLLCISTMATVNAWGKRGHEIVVLLAASDLSPEATATINKLTRGEPMMKVVNYPDDFSHSHEGRWSAPCHYSNVPRNSAHFNMESCTGMCVVKAIQNYTSFLYKAAKENKLEACTREKGHEPCPLEFLIHFVGDIHQPLHISYADDEGGNKVIADFLGEKKNLHEIWDEKLIEKWNPDATAATKELLEILHQKPELVEKYTASIDPIDWAEESYQFLLSNVYDFKMEKEVPHLDDEYFQVNVEVVKLRLIAAGSRLSHLLNKLFSEPNTL
jgi:hypothetical protein